MDSTYCDFIKDNYLRKISYSTQKPLKNGFAAAQKTFSLLVGIHIIMSDYLILN